MPWEKSFDVEETLDRAMQLFWARGYEATSMQTLVDCTGLHRGSLYAAYGDKRALFIAALRRYDDGMRRELVSDLEARYSPREAIRQLFLAFVAQASEPGCSRGCFLTNTALELAAHDPEICRIVAHAQKQIEAFFARLNPEGKSAGRDRDTRQTCRDGSRLIGLADRARRSDSQPTRPQFAAEHRE